jgi:ADP-heptose:LPS heptosyltransferase
VEILVLHPGALGDIILSLPALRILREHISGVRITLAANLDFAGAVSFGIADKVVSLSALPVHRLYRSMPPVEDARFWRGFDRIVSWTGSREEVFARNWSHIHPDVLSPCWKPGPGEGRHVSQLFFEGLRPWIPECAWDPRLQIRLDPEVGQRGRTWLREQGWDARKPLLALHCGAGSPEKRWPLPRYRELARILCPDWGLLMIEGPAEPALVRELNLSGPGILIAGNLPLPLLASVLQHSCRFIGNDSGIAHLAAGLGIPSILLFGPTNPAHWGPAGSWVSVLRAAENCAACLSGAAGVRHTCLEQVSVRAVLAAMRSMPPPLAS